MIYVALPAVAGGAVRPLPFYLAMEEYLARNYPPGEYFFMWQVEPTVIFGRCQNPFSEVNLEFCNANGISVFRRKSGGGCVYADMQNVMLSYVAPCRSAVAVTFSDYCGRVASMLCALGIEAEVSGRNDITVDGLKLSGNAFYHLHDRAILHGTMLFDADPERIAGVLTPSDMKLRAKGVASVRSRITTIRRLLPSLTLEEFTNHCRNFLCDSTVQLTPSDVSAIEEMAAVFFTDQWKWGRFGSAEQLTQRRRIEGVGEFAPRVALTPPAAPGLPATINHVDLQGDFFLLADLDSMLLDRLCGVEYTPDAIAKALVGVDTGAVIANLREEDLIRLLTESANPPTEETTACHQTIEVRAYSLT